MIRDISIQNFRCFENTTISGFGTVNLITGKNNAGKTALLEALILASLPIPETIASLKAYRNESPEFDKILPERAWDSLFLDQDNSKNISLQINEDNDQSSKVSIFIDDDPIQYFTEIDKSSNTSRLPEIYEDLLSSNSKTSVIKANIIINKNNNFEFSLIASNQGIIGRKFQAPDTKPVSFFSASSNNSNTNLTFEYDKARLHNREQEVLKGVRIIDSSIQLIESFSIGSPMLYLSSEEKKRLPLSLFGDAVKRVSAIILSIINHHSSILLIDEIENGIHHSSQVDLWKLLFRLAKELKALLGLRG
jgi:AAA15 family ATPase/GTPase